VEKVEILSGVRTQTLQMQNVSDEIEAPGTVIAVATAQVAARTMGTVLQVAIREGDHVSRGQLLALLDERELAALSRSAEAAEEVSNAGVAQATKALASAQAQADVAKKTYDRYIYLKEQKSVSAQEFDEVAAKYQAAQAGLEQAQAAVQQAQAVRVRAKSEFEAATSVASYARIEAPFDGRVVQRRVEPGSLVSPGRVAEMEAGADPASHTVRARVDLSKDPRVESGIFGRAFFAKGGRRALLVASDALVTRGQLRGIYVVDGGALAHWRVLTVGKTLGPQVEVLSGLGEGETVVLNPGTLELDGKRVSTAAIWEGESRQ